MASQPVTAVDQFRVLVCGGRDFNRPELVAQALEHVYRQHPNMLLIEGGARGADRHARAWANSRGVRVHTELADWELHGRKAGPLRNARMLALRPDVVVAFPGGSGTADMVRRAERAGVRVWTPLT